MMQKIFRKTPLAWMQLSKQKTRLLVAVSGIAFADLLMFIQMGFEGALYDSAMIPYNNLQAELMIANAQFETLFAVRSSPRERLYQVLAHPQVQAVTPVYIASGQWRNPENHKSRTILIWGVDPGTQSFKIPEVTQKLDQIKQINRVLFDQAGRPEYGNIADLLSKRSHLEVQINRQNLQVAGVFTIGSSFAADGNVVTSDSTFLRIFPERRPDQIEIGLIQLKNEANIEQVKNELQKILPNDVKVLKTEEWAMIEKNYWANGTGIGFIFNLGVMMGFIVGIIIVYQILYADVTDHLAEYATLKAMGYTDLYLLSMLGQEALILACLGFLPSLALAIGLYQLTYIATLLPISMNLERAVTVFLLTIVMCGISGTIAMRKLQSADPADIF
jgi:putative ABC transport system permease protein